MLGMAGNVGIQSSTLLVRGFATGEMVMSMALKTVGRQAALGTIIGAICGGLAGTLAMVLSGSARMGVAVAVSMAAGIVCAAAVGTLLPIVCQKIEVDPAVASGPFITTMNDLLGLLIYFLVASLLLIQTTS